MVTSDGRVQYSLKLRAKTNTHGHYFSITEKILARCNSRHGLQIQTRFAVVEGLHSTSALMFLRLSGSVPVSEVPGHQHLQSARCHQGRRHHRKWVVHSPPPTFKSWGVQGGTSWLHRGYRLLLFVA